jgi:glucose-6-phosphate isomerase
MVNDARVYIRQENKSVPKDFSIPVFTNVKRWIDSLPLFTELDLDLTAVLAHARQFRTFNDVIILGTGGSCLSGKMYSSFKNSVGPKMHFVDNIDSHEWNKLFANVSPQTTGVVAISKSGNTTETLCQTLMAVDNWRGLPEHFLFVTDPGTSALREIAEYYGITCIDHPIGIGGRFSGFSVVGLLPALIAGVDARDVLQGAKDAVEEFLKNGPTDDNAVILSAFTQNDLFLKGVVNSIIFCYAERLRPFAEWYRQLWAESVGKKDTYDETGKRYGTTPIIAIGTIDQHSQLQLYVDGPQDKFFSIIGVGDHPETPPIRTDGVNDAISQLLEGHTMADLMAAHQDATLQTLLENGNPTRSIFIPVLDERSLGQLMMFSILETLAIACVWNVDPFNQPGVKSCKDKVFELMRR